MSATAVSEPILCAQPTKAHVRIVRDDREGTILLILSVGNVPPMSVTFDATGWRGLSHAMGVPPAAEFVPETRTCACCGRDRRTVRNWAAANLCEACVGKPLPRAVQQACKGGRP
jgi:hypothetical protein